MQECRGIVSDVSPRNPEKAAYGAKEVRQSPQPHTTTQVRARVSASRCQPQLVKESCELNGSIGSVTTRVLACHNFYPPCSREVDSRKLGLTKPRSFHQNFHVTGNVLYLYVPMMLSVTARCLIHKDPLVTPIYLLHTDLLQ